MNKQEKKAETTNTGSASVTQQGTQTGAGNADAVALLKADHRTVEGLFEKYQKANSISEKQQLAQQVCTELIVHTMLEEELFYAACREKGVQSKLLDEAQVEHDGAKVLINELLKQSPEEEFYDAKVKVLSEYIKHHVAEEEKPGEGIFEKAKEAGVDLKGLGAKLQARKNELLAHKENLQTKAVPFRSLNVTTNSTDDYEERNMNQQSHSRNRDERGRFTDDDDYNRGGRQYGRGNDYEEDQRSGGGGRSSGSGRGWYGDSEGHSRASEQRWEGQGSSRGRYDEDEDNGRYSNRSSGGGRGWSGDSEGHSRASEQGWENRGSSRGRYDEDENNGRYSSRSSGGRGQGGWFGDSEGHSRASEQGWENRGSSRGRYDEDEGGRYSSRSSGGGRSSGSGRGWFGDSEGHSRAAEEGWESRGSSRSRSDDDEGNGRSSRSGGRGHGGWFGDSRGHSEAARHRS